MLLTTNGLVLRETNYKESDKIITVLTSAEGKLAVKVRGTARKSRLHGAGVQFLCYSEMILFGNQGRWTLNEAGAIEQFLGLREDIESLALAAYFAELLEALSDEEHPSAELLRLGLNSLFALSRKYYEPAHIKAVFEMRLMCLAGYEPRLDSCVRCGEEISQKAFFSFDEGGVCCGYCGLRDIGKCANVEPGLLMALNHIVLSAPKKIFSFTLRPDQRSILGVITEKYLKTQLERGFSTLDYWKKLRGA